MLIVKLEYEIQQIPQTNISGKITRDTQTHLQCISTVKLLSIIHFPFFSNAF